MAALKSTRSKPTRLTHTYVQSLTRPGRYGDGRGSHGLSLRVKPTKNGSWSRTWSQRIRIGGTIRTLGLGAFPVITLADARERALDNARRVARGEDILKPPPIIPTVDQAFDIVIEQRRPSWKAIRTELNWRLSKRYCHPIGSKLVSEIRQKDIVDILAPIWQKKPNLARDVRSNLSTVMAWAINREHRTHNPATPAVVQELGKQPLRSHHPSLEPDQLGSTLALIRDADAWWAEKYCLIFLGFTGVRSGEAREATWNEINLDDATWTIPGDRMKNGILHKVPLSAQAVEILLYAREQTGHSEGVIFPPERRSHHMGSNRLSRLMQNLKIPAVPHGSRSSFINWAAGRPHIPEAVAEMVLAHVPAEAVKRAYRTSDFFEHRRPIMQEWADFLTETMGPVISTIPDVYKDTQEEKRASSHVRTFKVDPIGEDEYKLIVQKVQDSQIQDTWDAPDQDTLRGAVDVAAIALMRDGLLRPRETADALWSDLRREADGSGLLNIRSSKKNRSGTDRVAYASPRTMKALDEIRRIRRDLRMDAKDDRILQMTENALYKHIQKACHAAGLTGIFGGFSPRNGMAQDLIRSGVGVNDLKEAKGWRLMATTHSERESLARNGAVAQWYAQKETEAKETHPVVQEDFTDDCLEESKPIFQNWANFGINNMEPVISTAQELPLDIDARLI